MLPAEAVRAGAEYLAAHGVESPHASAEVLMMHVLGTDRAGLFARREGLDQPTASRYARALYQRCTGVPLQHLTGEQEFMGLSLRVEPGVFVPRPETEVVVERALETLRDARNPVVVVVGTGTGAIALAVARERPDATVLATDVSGAAVRVARRNSERLGIAIDVRGGDLLSPVQAELRGRVDLLVSNPPYVPLEDYEALPLEVKAEPYEALVGGTRVHRRLAEASAVWLRPSGWLVVEIGADQAPEVRDLFEAAGLRAAEVLPDLAGRDRVVRARRMPAGAAHAGGDLRGAG